MESGEVNLLAVLIAAALYFFLGGVWYSEKLFGHIWAKEVVDHDKRSKNSFLIAEGIIGLIIASILALFISATGAAGVFGGVKIGFLIWIGFVATFQLSSVLWGKRSLKHFFVNTGFDLVALSLMGAVIALLS